MSKRSVPKRRESVSIFMRLRLFAGDDFLISLFSSAAMTIKDVLQALVDDAMVDTEKVGTSNYYWSFPSKGQQAVRRYFGADLSKSKKKEKKAVLKLKTVLLRT